MRVSVQARTPHSRWDEITPSDVHHLIAPTPYEDCGVSSSLERCEQILTQPVGVLSYYVCPPPPLV
jgi:hypothetical protein